MNTKKIGEVWWYDIGTKTRPVVIIDEGDVLTEVDITISNVTSQKARGKYDVELKYWQEAGLKKPSVVRCGKLTTIENFKLKRSIGKLHPEDLFAVLETVALRAQDNIEKVKARLVNNEEG